VLWRALLCPAEIIESEYADGFSNVDCLARRVSRYVEECRLGLVTPTFAQAAHMVHEIVV
jgi:hypothetical protein